MILEDDIDKAIAHLKGEFNNIRAGRANPHILDKILVDYYGTPTPIGHMANISVQEGRILVISPWDQSQVRAICKEISASDIGLTPADDGRVIRLTFPQLTEERRRELVKSTKKLAEDAKVACRNARRDAIDELKKLKNNGLSEDQEKGEEDNVQKKLDAAIANIDKLMDEKEKDIMTV
ncbi:MAG: ribosome recycling factor [Clostridia bacterium]|nr:ribosome recycling factor [Clostridia bacterium]